MEYDLILPHDVTTMRFTTIRATHSGSKKSEMSQVNFSLKKLCPVPIFNNELKLLEISVIHCLYVRILSHVHT